MRDADVDAERGPIDHPPGSGVPSPTRTAARSLAAGGGRRSPGSWRRCRPCRGHLRHAAGPAVARRCHVPPVETRAPPRVGGEPPISGPSHAGSSDSPVPVRRGGRVPPRWSRSFLVVTRNARPSRRRSPRTRERAHGGTTASSPARATRCWKLHGAWLGCRRRTAVIRTHCEGRSRMNARTHIRLVWGPSQACARFYRDSTSATSGGRSQWRATMIARNASAQHCPPDHRGRSVICPAEPGEPRRDAENHAHRRGDYPAALGRGRGQNGTRGPPRRGNNASEERTTREEK